MTNPAESTLNTARVTLTGFLLARIVEDKAEARAALSDRGPGGWRDPTWQASLAADTNATIHSRRHDPFRVLAECEAKRRIVTDHEWDETPGSPVQHSRELRHLATIYATHPDYREEWRP
jgi:hypothetical protein